MIYKTLASTTGQVRVTFELPSCIWADRIYLVGDFNHWDEQATPMHQDRDGVWRAVIELEYGSQCEFRYLIDGQWRTDYHADGYTNNSFGSENSVITAVLPEDTRLLERLSSRIREGVPSDRASGIQGRSTLLPAQAETLRRRTTGASVLVA
jgi:hypothetical protein